ncbi:MAG: hypothetical protein WKG00_38100, partial [Polyangiaceae bacterium]
TAHVENVTMSANSGVGLGFGGGEKGIIIICKSAITGTEEALLPVFENSMDLGSSQMLGDGLEWLGGSVAELEQVSLSGNARASILIDGAASGSLVDVTLSGGDEQKGILQQSLGSGEPQPTLGVNAPAGHRTTEQLAVAKPPKAVGALWQAGSSVKATAAPRRDHRGAEPCAISGRRRRWLWRRRDRCAPRAPPHQLMSRVAAAFRGAARGDDPGRSWASPERPSPGEGAGRELGRTLISGKNPQKTAVLDEREGGHHGSIVAPDYAGAGPRGTVDDGASPPQKRGTTREPLQVLAGGRAPIERVTPAGEDAGRRTHLLHAHPAGRAPRW